MSDWAEKLAAPARQADGKAQAPRGHLLGRWGARELDVDTIAIDTMGGREVWRRLERKGRAAAGDAFVQEVRS